jgi:GNAT superfamily N-acetyltransferase
MTSANDSVEHDRQVVAALSRVPLPAGLTIRTWLPADFPAIQRLSAVEGWPTPTQRPDEALVAWLASWPALVAATQDQVIAFLRALSDGAVTTYVDELLVAPQWRGQGVGSALLEVCHELAPGTRLDLLAGGQAERFYVGRGFRRFMGFRKSWR